MSVVHLSDWASQPEVRIACTQEIHFPWKIRKDLPKDIHEISQDNNESILYTFNLREVTCEKCKSLDCFNEGMSRLERFEKDVKESGLTEDEYVAKLRLSLIGNK